MYQGWVTHTHSHLGGRCPHECSYCYVDNPRFGRPERYKGELRLIEKEFSVKYGSGKSIFIESMNDLFADEVGSSFIYRILKHCKEYPDNVYVFQTKNPSRYAYVGRIESDCYLTWPEQFILGCTIESNRNMSKISKSPSTNERAYAMRLLSGRKFVTIEPILQFDLKEMIDMIVPIKPEFVNIGADSKGNNLPEPTWFEVMSLIDGLKKAGIEVREKSNLDRLMKYGVCSSDI
jgi:protein gp37